MLVESEELESLVETFEKACGVAEKILGEQRKTAPLFGMEEVNLQFLET